MTRRNIEAAGAIRQAYAALQAGDFAAAMNASAAWTADPGGALLHALGQAGAGDCGGAAALATIARANPQARHPVLDLVDLLRRHGRDPAPALRASLAHAPDDPALLAALGSTLAETGPMDQAVEAFHKVAERQPGDAAAWSNLGNALAAESRFEAAEAAFAKAAGLRPLDAQIGLNRAVAMLKSGDLSRGWPLFRARHALPGRAPPLPGTELRSLDGVAGRTVLLLHDEGFGDTLQFIRFAPILEAAGARVLVWAPVPLARLLAGNGFGTVTGPVQADAWCRIPDLPAVFGTTLATIPGTLPYLRAEPALVAQWAQRLPPGRRVGVAWAGAARSHDPAAAATDRIRSIASGRLGPLLAAPGVQWIGLQLGQPAPAGVFDPMAGVTDFADTAAIIAGLEAVVSVDTAVAHLAGAMGKPVVLLDRYDNCWRWLSGRDDSPWYPGRLHVVRQPAPGDWDSVLCEAARLIGQRLG